MLSVCGLVFVVAGCQRDEVPAPATDTAGAVADSDTAAPSTDTPAADHGAVTGDTVEEGIDRAALLEAAEDWMYQIQKLQVPGAVETLAAHDYPLLVIEPGFNHRACQPGTEDPPDGYPECETQYDTESIVEALRTRPGGGHRLLIAYVDIGQAEAWRDYWDKDWIAPTKTKAGYPAYLLAPDADEWVGNYTVAYWDEEWLSIWLDPDEGIIKELAELGFDGVYLDWVEAYDDDAVRARAKEDDVDPPAEMIKFLEGIRDAGRQVTPDFLVIQQNSPHLIKEASSPAAFAEVIDALACEDTWYFGDASADWESGVEGTGYTLEDRIDCEAEFCTQTLVSPDIVCAKADRLPGYTCNTTFAMGGGLHGGDRHSEDYTTADRLATYQTHLDAGIPVFTVDYALTEEHAQEVYDAAWGADLRPLVTRVSLEKDSETPPWDHQ